MENSDASSRSAALWTQPRAPRRKWITKSKAARLVDTIAALTECTDATPELRRALEDARRAISPWYDN